MSKPIIKVDNLTKKFTLGNHSADIRRSVMNYFSKKNDPVEIKALDNISFSIDQGEVFGIIGPNGSGKSTLLKILSKITYPTSGKATIRGRVSSLLEVGTGFHPELTGRENIFLNGSILGMKRQEIKSKFDEIVDFSGVEKFIDTPVKHYSSGMYVRLAFSVAAHLEPEILLVDEVLAVGDFEFQQKAFEKFDQLVKSENKTIVLISHNMTILRNICTSIGFLNQGKLIDLGSPTTVIEKYLSQNKDETIYVEYYNRENKEIWIQKAYIKGDTDKTQSLFSGLTAQIVFEYRTIVQLKNVNIDIGIYNMYNEKILHLSNKYSIDDCFIVKKKGVVMCTIENMPLVPGNYYTNISINIENKVIDKIDRAFIFKVENYDFFKTGKLPPIKGNKVFVNQSWQYL